MIKHIKRKINSKVILILKCFFNFSLLVSEISKSFLSNILYLFSSHSQIKNKEKKQKVELLKESMQKLNQLITNKEILMLMNPLQKVLFLLFYPIFIPTYISKIISGLSTKCLI